MAEWTPGRSSCESAETVPSPIGAARAIRALAWLTPVQLRTLTEIEESIARHCDARK
ncbi:hypothetical protein [Nocardia brasiliensis]|uniref:hypothetical protein n=1 Tax=Nocardia brasiliensis TaxID=37326 RepID=UPI0024556E9C|nr:hypothetical protein [Nocardia brasiliensis]